MDLLLIFSFPYHCQYFYRTWLYIWVTRRVSYKKQELPTFREHLNSAQIIDGVRVAHLISFLCCPITCLYIPCSVRVYLHVYTEGLMS